MKAIINSESLTTLARLVKAESYQVLVKDKKVKIVGVEKNRDKIVYQVSINEDCFGNEEDGIMEIPKEVISLLPRKSNCIIKDNKILAEGQEIITKLDLKSKKFNEIDIEDKNIACIQNFKEMSECKYAVAEDHLRPILNCIYLDKNNMVALDGYRLSVRSYAQPITDNPILIPEPIVKTLKYFKKEDIATIVQDDNYVKICFGKISITAIKDSKIKNSKYIKYDALIPKEHKIKVSVISEKIVDICKKIDRSNKSSNLLRIILNKKQSYFKVNTSLLEYKIYFNAKIEGDDIEIAVNTRYLLETFQNYTGEVAMYITNPVSPILVTNEWNKTDLILPIRIGKKENV